MRTLVIFSLMVLASGFFIPISFARWATQESYGQFIYVISLMGLLSLFGLPGMNDAVIQGVARGEEGIWLVALRMRLRWAIVGVVVLCGIGVAFLFLLKSPLGVVLLILSPFLLTYVLDSTKAFLTGQTAFRKVAWVNAGSNFLPVLTVAFLLWLGHEEVLWTTLGYFISLLCFYLFVFLMVFTARRPRSGFSEKTLRYGQHMSLVSSFGVFQTYIDKLIVGSLLGFADLALFSVAGLFQIPIKHLSWGVFYPLLLPSYAKAPLPSLRSEITRWLKRTAVASLLGFFAAIFLVSPFVELAFGESYKRIVPYAMVFILSGFCLIPGMIFDLALRSKQMNFEIYILRIGQLLITAASLLVLIPIFSLLGAVLADLVSNILYSFLGFFLTLRIGERMETEASLKSPLRVVTPLQAEWGGEAAQLLGEK